MEALRSVRVIIFGIGGVGSWTAEALIRTGITHLTIVDADKVATSNINRQVPATTLTVGMDKTTAMRNHLLTINPEAEIEAINDIYTLSTAHKYTLESYDYIIDAIDSLADKQLLIYNATHTQRTRLFSSMGAALKISPSRIRTDEFWNVKGCRLAAALRHRIKKSGQYPGMKFLCVYSDEIRPNKGTSLLNDQPNATDSPMTFNKVTTNGSLCHVTAIFGMTLAGLLIEDAIAKIPPTT